MNQIKTGTHADCNVLC